MKYCHDFVTIDHRYFHVPFTCFRYTYEEMKCRFWSVFSFSDLLPH